MLASTFPLQLLNMSELSKFCMNSSNMNLPYHCHVELKEYCPCLFSRRVQTRIQIQIQIQPGKLIRTVRCGFDDASKSSSANKCK